MRTVTYSIEGMKLDGLTYEDIKRAIGLGLFNWFTRHWMIDFHFVQTGGDIVFSPATPADTAVGCNRGQGLAAAYGGEEGELRGRIAIAECRFNLAVPPERGGNGSVVRSQDILHTDIAGHETGHLIARLVGRYRQHSPDSDSLMSPSVRGDLVNPSPWDRELLSKALGPPRPVSLDMLPRPWKGPTPATPPPPGDTESEWKITGVATITTDTRKVPAALEPRYPLRGDKCEITGRFTAPHQGFGRQWSIEEFRHTSYGPHQFNHPDGARLAGPWIIKSGAAQVTHKRLTPISAAIFVAGLSGTWTRYAHMSARVAIYQRGGYPALITNYHNGQFYQATFSGAEDRGFGWLELGVRRKGVYQKLAEPVKVEAREGKLVLRVNKSGVVAHLHADGKVAAVEAVDPNPLPPGGVGIRGLGGWWDDIAYMELPG